MLVFHAKIWQEKGLRPFISRKRATRRRNTLQSHENSKHLMFKTKMVDIQLSAHIAVFRLLFTQRAEGASPLEISENFSQNFFIFLFISVDFGFIFVVISKQVLRESKTLTVLAGSDIISLRVFVYEW